MSISHLMQRGETARTWAYAEDVLKRAIDNDTNRKRQSVVPSRRPNFRYNYDRCLVLSRKTARVIPVSRRQKDGINYCKAQWGYLAAFYLHVAQSRSVLT